MSYYGPASQDSADRPHEKVRRRLSQYDYHRHRAHDEQSVQLHRAGHFNRHNKRLRRSFRITPWRDEREFQAVGKALLSVLDPANDTSNQDMSPEEAFATISVWKSRLESLPHAVESTATLAQVYWRDSQRRCFRGSTTSISVMELRLAYSSAIVRCINGFADILQQQRAMAASVSSLCGQLGIPSWVVDVRHEGAHNALPNLEVLRLSTSTLLEFMRSEYWVPRCAEWNECDNETSSMIETDGRVIRQDDRSRSKNRLPIDFLIDYNLCASDWFKARGSGFDDSEAKGDKKTTGKRHKKSSSGPPKTTILPYDPLFGEVGTFGDSSDEDDDNSAAGDDNRKGEPKLDKPVVNSIWGSSVGTNTNRYILLDITSKKKKKGKGKKKQKKSIANDVKKKKGEKSPTDFAKLFVQSVSSLQEGHRIAIQYLIWGGVGGAPMGQGILICRPENAFPATSQGVIKCWELYSPLVYVISRTWPGFAANMMTNLVDCILSTKDGSLSYDKEAEKSTQKQHEKATNSKLYFLSAWIRLLLSQRFVAALDQSFADKSTSGKNNNPFELPLAELKHLESLGYPLGSLLDRCRRFHKDNENRNCSKNFNKNSIDVVSCDSDLIETIRSVIRNLETILGEKEAENFGYPETTVSRPDSQQNPSGQREGNEDGGATTNAETEISTGTMSLDEMEKMLLLEDDNNRNESDVKTDQSIKGGSDACEKTPIVPTEPNATESQPPIRRPAWIRCARWDACSIGSLPGYPS